MSALIHHVSTKVFGALQTPQGATYVCSSSIGRGAVQSFHRAKSIGPRDTSVVVLERNAHGTPAGYAGILITRGLSMHEVELARQAAEQSLLTESEQQTLRDYGSGYIANDYNDGDQGFHPAQQFVSLLRQGGVWLVFTWHEYASLYNIHHPAVMRPPAFAPAGQLHAFRMPDGPDPEFIMECFLAAGVGCLVLPIAPKTMVDEDMAWAEMQQPAQQQQGPVAAVVDGQVE